MEAKGCSPRWKMHLPGFKHSRRRSSPTAKDSELGKTERERDRGGPHKSVAMAPTSRYLTDRQYVMRKPLFSEDQHPSILKKTPPQRHTEKEKQLSVSRREGNQRTDMNFLTRPREELTPESFSLSDSDISPPSAWRKPPDAPLGVSELRARLRHEEPTFGSPFPGSRSARRSLSSSFLAVQRLSPPLRPQLMSTVLYPSYTPRSGHSRPGQTRLRLGGREGETKLCSPGGHSKGHSVSPYQADYWACAIPRALPPSADRHSAAWDPNREYQALLDYTYPLRPGQVVCEGDSSKLQGDSVLQMDPNLQDSGIDLDQLCSSTSLSGLDLSLSVGRQGFTGSSDGPPSGILLSLTHPVGLSLDSLDCSKNEDGVNRSKCDGRCHHHRAPSSSTSAAFSCSTRVLPQSKCVCGEVDEEFWPLPDQLEEPRLLSRQVREVTAQLSRPVTASWESLEPGTTSILSSVTLPEKQEAEEEEGAVKEMKGSNQDRDEGKDEAGREKRRSVQTADHRDSEAVRRSRGSWLEPVGGGPSPSSLREVEVLVERLCGLTLPDSQRSSQEDQEQGDSLIQHIQVFCSHLEQLIQQLYSVSENMELLTAPTVGRVKSSLAEYQSFQREVSSHQPLTSGVQPLTSGVQPLTSGVLHTGQLLLSCIDTMSPFLRDTLLLIERQSGALETHTDHFFSSILSTMDSFRQPPQPSPVQQSKKEDPGLVGVQGPTL